MRKRHLYKNLLSRYWVFFACGILTLIFTVFHFLEWFFLSGLPNRIIVHSRSSFYLVNANSPNCLSGLVLLCLIYLVGRIFVPTMWLHNHHFKSFSTLSGECFFCSFAWINFWLHVTYLTLKNSLLWNWFSFVLIQRYKVKWVCYFNWGVF